MAAESPYQPLFRDVALYVQCRGEADTNPRDPSFPPGLDGTLRPGGDGQAYAYDYTVPPESIPPTINDLEVCGLSASYYSEAIMGETIHPESLHVKVVERSGIRRIFNLSRTLGEVTAHVTIDIDDDDEPIPDESISDDAAASPLSEQQQEDILQALMDGDQSLLRMEGPQADFARGAHLLMSGVDHHELSPDDLNLLQAVRDVMQRL